ncbi:MAG: small subunit ribosomal protein S1, partial [Enterobacterales bacterium]
MSESFAELFEESLKDIQMSPGSIIDGEIMAIDNENVIVNAGLKSEGVIPLVQFRADNGDLNIKVGDIVKVALDAVEDGSGETKLSRDKAKRAEAWIRLEEAYEA